MIQKSEHYLATIARLNDDTKLSELAHNYQRNLVNWRKDIITISNKIDAMAKEGHIEKVELEAYSHDRIEFSIEMTLGHSVYITVGHANDYYTEKYMFNVRINGVNISVDTNNIEKVLIMLDAYNYLFVTLAGGIEVGRTLVPNDKLYFKQKQMSENAQS